MRSKAPLILMEQLIMLLVFALAAALCLQAFVRSDTASRQSGVRDHAVTLAQTAAEAVRYCGGDTDEALSGAAELLGAEYEQGLLWLDYDENGDPSPDGPCRLTVQDVPVQTLGLNKVRVTVTWEEDILFEIEVAWQGEAVSYGQ